MTEKRQRQYEDKLPRMGATPSKDAPCPRENVCNVSKFMDARCREIISRVQPDDISCIVKKEDGLAEIRTQDPRRVKAMS